MLRLRFAVCASQPSRKVHRAGWPECRRELGVYDYSIGNAYSSLYALYEKLGDYVINVSEAIDSSRKHSED